MIYNQTGTYIYEQNNQLLVKYIVVILDKNRTVSPLQNPDFIFSRK